MNFYDLFIVCFVFPKGHLTVKSDIYSFGVVLLELLSGRRAIDKNRPNGEQKLVEWARPYLNSKRKIFRVMDPRIEGQYSIDHALKAADLALKCLSDDPKLRPTMIEVVRELEMRQDSSNEMSDPRRGNRQLGQFSHAGTEMRTQAGSWKECFLSEAKPSCR